MISLSLFYPVFVLVALTIAVGVMTGRARRAAVVRGKVRIKDIALGQPAWPARVMQLGNNYNNQFQLPVLFYVLVAFAMITGTQSIFLVVLAWAFVASRVAHTYIHITSNNVARRFRAFLAGILILIVMWLALLWHVVILGVAG